MSKDALNPHSNGIDLHASALPNVAVHRDDAQLESQAATEGKKSARTSSDALVGEHQVREEHARRGAPRARASLPGRLT